VVYNAICIRTIAAVLSVTADADSSIDPFPLISNGRDDWRLTALEHSVRVAKPLAIFITTMILKNIWYVRWPFVIVDRQMKIQKTLGEVLFGGSRLKVISVISDCGYNVQNTLRLLLAMVRLNE
jgi:hypothetical protein